MAETCIVCLSDLRHPGDRSLPSEAAVQDAGGDEVQSHASKKRSLRNTRLTSKSVDDDDEIVAHLLPCKHNLHNACLKPWVERANSCPICRATFNTVELSAAVGGEVIDTYVVKDKVQEAEFDVAAIVNGNDDELFEWDTEAPCTFCDMIDDSHEVMYCDGCDTIAHVFCGGFSEHPDVWYCVDCQADAGMVDVDTQQRPVTARRRIRGRPVGDRRGRRNDMNWARVWQEVSRRLDIDLDFPFTEDTHDHRTEEQRREFNRWHRRFQVADRQGDRQGNARRLRNIAARLQPPQQITRPAPESQEEIRAWNAFEKARESQEEPTQLRRKRPRTESPASERENVQQRQLKRPRLRRPQTNAEQTHAESSTSAAQRTVDEPTFLSSLLREVEQNPVNAASPGASEGHNGQRSPRNSSPVRSPSSSGQATPRALSVTPPPPPPLPPGGRHSASPPLCSTILPPPSPPGLTFSPFSPTIARPESDIKRHQRGRARMRVDAALQNGMHEAIVPSPVHDRSDRFQLSLASKEEIQRMVKLALKPRYRDNQLTKDQYTEINRDVSRHMYDLVGNATALTNEQERAKWQNVAEQEVQRAITTLAEFNATALDTEIYDS